MDIENAKIVKIEKVKTDRVTDRRYVELYIEVDGTTRRFIVNEHPKRAFDITAHIRDGLYQEGDIVDFNVNKPKYGGFEHIWKMKKRNT